jgi:hypothetical protein
MTWNTRLVAWALGVALIFGAGMGTGWSLWKPKPAKPETYAAPIVQGDGSLVLERKPQADAKPAQQVPKGGKVERVIQVTVAPTPSGPEPALPSHSGSGALPEPARPPCPPVRVDLTLVRMPDDSRRVVASSPDGRVVGGVDIPLSPSAPPRPLVWAAGGLYRPQDKAVGAWIDRDLGFVRLGVEVIRAPAPTNGVGPQWSGMVKAGIRF